jgi:RNA polymerase sigma-70 factor (ECF subfamily)
MKYTNDINTAEDYCHNGFLKVYENLHKYKGDAPIEGWVWKIMKHTIIDTIRKDKFPINKSMEITMSNLPEEDETPYTPKYSFDQVKKVLPKVSPAYREVFKLYYFEGMIHSEIGETLGVSDGTSKAHLHRAKKQINSLLETGRR